MTAFPPVSLPQVLQQENLTFAPFLALGIHAIQTSHPRTWHGHGCKSSPGISLFSGRLKFSIELQLITSALEIWLPPFSGRHKSHGFILQDACHIHQIHMTYCLFDFERILLTKSRYHICPPTWWGCTIKISTVIGCFFRIFMQFSNLRVIFQQGTGMRKVLTNKEIRWNSFRCSLRPIAQAIKGSSATFKGNIIGENEADLNWKLSLFFKHGAMPHKTETEFVIGTNPFLLQFLLRHFHRFPPTCFASK